MPAILNTHLRKIQVGISTLLHYHNGILTNIDAKAYLFRFVGVAKWLQMHACNATLQTPLCQYTTDVFSCRHVDSTEQTQTQCIFI